MGAQIATTWGILLHNGLDYYKTISCEIISATNSLKKFISDTKIFKVIGNPTVNVVAFNSDKYPLGLIIDNFKKSGWNLNILQNPLALHICITPNNIDQLTDFKNVINHILTIEEINDSENNLVAIYGMAEKIPNKNIVNEIVEKYLDYTTDL